MVNNIVLLGAVVRHSLRTTAKLTPVLEVTLAGVDTVGERRFAWYHQANYLGKRAERLAELLSPGAGAAVLGSLEFRTWEAQDGTKRSRLNIQAGGLEVFPLAGEDLEMDQGGNPRLVRGAVNRVTLAGNLTRDPEQGERGPAKAGLAITEWVPGRAGEKGHEKVHFVDLVAWNGSSEILLELGKGDPAWVEGRLVAESWEAQDGAKRYATRVEVARMIPLIRPPKAEVGEPDLPPI